MNLFDFLKASNFFPKYCPGVTNYINKMRGKNGKNQPLDFSPEDDMAIMDGIDRFREDVKKHFNQKNESHEQK